MQKLIVGVIALTLAAGAAYAQGPNRAAVEKQIAENERLVNEAVSKNDAATFRKFVADDSWGIDPSGAMATTEFLKVLNQVKIEPGWKIDSSKFMWVNNDVVVHMYRWTGKGTMMGETFPSPAHASTVWANRGGRWVATFHQETAAAPPPKPAKK